MNSEMQFSSFPNHIDSIRQATLHLKTRRTRKNKRSMRETGTEIQILLFILQIVSLLILLLRHSFQIYLLLFNSITYSKFI